MKKLIVGVVIGLLLGSGIPALAGEFGWTDTTKLGRVADAAEAILAELKGIRAELNRKP